MDIQKNLRQHQWKAFRRHPMFERNLGVRIFMFIMFGFLGLELLAFGFFLDKLCLEIGNFERAIDCFNSFWIYIFMADFVIKFMLKKSQSMQIAPYLTIPIRRNRLFDFLLVKEFSNIWNLYMLFLVVPFTLKSVPPFFGVGAAFLYLIFFYLLCVGNSFLVRIADNLFKRSVWFILLPILVIAVILLAAFGLDFSFGDYTQRIGEWVLNYNPLVWLGLIAGIVVLWIVNRMQMRSEVYREMQGEKSESVLTFSNLSFLDRLGEVGEFINMEIKMISRSKRIRAQLFALAYILIFGFFQLYAHGELFQGSPFISIFWLIFMIGGMGLIMGQYLFMTESSSFDGLMARNHSMFNLLRAKYLFYSSFAFLVALSLLVPVYHGKISLLLVVSVFFFTIGPIFGFLFQNAVYNKSPLDLFDGGMFNWKGTSPSMLMITMAVMFVPVILIAIIGAVFSITVACYVMLIIGLTFTLMTNRWLSWTYKRFVVRKYKNMEGFRSN